MHYICTDYKYSCLMLAEAIEMCTDSNDDKQVHCKFLSLSTLHGRSVSMNQTNST